MSPENKLHARAPGRALHVVAISALVAAVAAASSLAAGRKRARAEEAAVRESAAAEGVRVLVTKAESAPPTRTITLQGDVRPFRQTTLYAKVSGYLRSLRVDRGDVVRTDQILGVIQSPETEQQEASARADLQLRERTAERVRKLMPSGVVSGQELDNATSGLDVARAEVARIRALRGYEVLRAPFAGRITERYVDPGALLSAATGSTQSAQPVLDLADLSRVRIFVYPGQLDAANMHEGDKVTIWTDSAPSQKREDRIVRMTHSLDPRTRTMLAEIDVDNTDDRIHPGSFVHVQIAVNALPSVSIPADSVIIRDGRPNVAIARDGHAHFVPIEVSDDDGKRVRVNAGLAAGDDVILHPSDDVVDGAVVKIAPRKESK